MLFLVLFLSFFLIKKKKKDGERKRMEWEYFACCFYFTEL